MSGLVLRQQRGIDLYLFEKRRFSRLCPRHVKTLEHQGPTRQAWPGSKKQEERQHYRYVDRYCAQRVMTKSSGLYRCQRRPLVVILPRMLETESKAAPQDICIPDGIIHYPNGRSLLPVECLELLAFSRVKIEEGFHTAGKHIRFRFAICPERSHQAAAPFGIGLDEYAAPARAGRINTVFEPVKCKLISPGSFGPFDPHALCRNVQKVCTSECARSFRIGECRA